MNKIYGKLARNNIVNNRQLYVPYILSGMMTAALFYVINFLCGNPGLDRIPGSAALGTILALGVSVIGIFAYIFIFYTNSFISKHRKRSLAFIISLVWKRNILPGYCFWKHCLWQCVPLAEDCSWELYFPS